MEKYRVSPHEELTHLLIQWLQRMRTENFPFNGPVLWKKAPEIALRLKVENFKASNGWLDQFKKCHSVSYKTVVKVELSLKTL
jgi:hypothetical protein